MAYLGPKTSNLNLGTNYISNGKAYYGRTGWSTYRETDSVTFQDTGDTVTLNNHGLSNNTQIAFTSITSTTGISINTAYFVVNATTNTFQVASSSGGSALPLTTDGSGTLVRSIPKTGSGGINFNFSFGADAGTQLRQGSYFYLDKTSSTNVEGSGAAFDFTIDNADLAKVLTISFDYQVFSGTYSTGDVTIYLIQDPTTTPVVIQPAGFQIQAGSVGTRMKHIATFQTASNATSYRLCFHVSTPSTSNYQLQFDNISVGPQVVQYGAPVTDYQDRGAITISATTTAPTKGATKQVDRMLARRVGDEAEILYEYSQSAGGTNGTGSYLFSLPAGMSFDSSKVVFSGTVSSLRSNNITAIGNGAISISSVSGFNANVILFAYDSTRFYALITSSQNSTGAGDNGVDEAVGSINYVLSDSSFSFRFFLKAPILGWSSTVQMSNDTDTRVIATTVNRITTAQSPATSGFVKILFNNTLFDKNGSWDSANTRYICRIPGTYSGSGFIHISNSSAVNIAVALYRNGVAFKQVGSVIGSATARTSIPFSFLADFNAGDILELYINCGGATLTIEQDGVITGGSQWNISRISGPSAIAASETVAARYYTVAGPVVNNTAPVITYGTKVYDSHGAMSGSTYTVPVSGKYRVTQQAAVSTTAFVATDALEGYLIVNGSATANATLGSYRVAANVTSGISINGSVELNLNAGDTLTFKLYSDRATSLITTGSGSNNYITISRIGN